MDQCVWARCMSMTATLHPSHIHTARRQSDTKKKKTEKHQKNIIHACGAPRRCGGSVYHIYMQLESTARQRLNATCCASGTGQSPNATCANFEHTVTAVR